MFHKVQVICCILVMLATVIKMGLGEADRGECTCGGFTDLGDLSKIILEQTLPGRLVSCDENGAEDCRKKCNRMVKVVPVNVAVEIFCSKLNDTINILEMHLFAKICETNDWTAAGYKTPKPICCKNGKSVSCE
ncbi:hypothetical protein PV327_007247 [Microctonus hyperodae]|uniref:Uncharacterized protein n=1 Tax=Microctonus hyperodae TaxID=165561 RepID=A0AA39F649_MICHY|nr:hypothetical protein PV327_007247 [Microctonus hyperodae]